MTRSDRPGRAGEGTVHLAENLVDGQLCWFGYWDSGTPGVPEESWVVLEKMPSTMSSAKAVVWGRIRSNRVVVRTEDGQLWWAGAAERPVDVPCDWPDDD